MERTVRDESALTVHVSAHGSERELLDAMAAFVTGRFADQDVLVVAYNGETWRGGVDVPFLRTRLAAHDVAWLFTDVAEAHGWDESVTSSAAGGARLEISGVDTATTG